ncbi:MAG TPA: aspartyl protease family protein [Pirellulales bacterium]|nr:aspartyl protease family protein [Pirellulales bacterium]
METETMGRVLTTATIENSEDLWLVRRGELSNDQARRVTVDDAVVDTGATYLSLPPRLIWQLGLNQLSTRPVRTTAGVVEARFYDAVRLTIQGRFCTIDVLEVPDNVPTLIGQVPLELLDFVVDPGARKLIGNPEHGGQFMHDQF